MFIKENGWMIKCMEKANLPLGKELFFKVNLKITDIYNDYHAVILNFGNIPLLLCDFSY